MVAKYTSNAIKNDEAHQSSLPAPKKNPKNQIKNIITIAVVDISAIRSNLLMLKLTYDYI